MSDNGNNKVDPLIKGISSNDEKFAERIELLEEQIYQKTLTRLKNTIIIAITALTAILGIGGFLTFSNIRTSIEDKAVKGLIDDVPMKNEIIKRTELNIGEIEKLKTSARDLVEQMKSERAEAGMVLDNNMDQIVVMLQKIDSLSNARKK
jgi:hypothetical protein